MAALQGQVSIPQTALPAGSSLTVCRLKAPTNQRVRVLGYGFFFDGTSNTAQPVQVQIGRIWPTSHRPPRSRSCPTRRS